MGDWLAIVLLAAAGLGSVSYIAVYTRYADWWRTEIGWSLVGFPGVLGLLAVNGLVYRLLGDYPGRQAVNVALWLVWVAVVWWLTSLVYRSNHATRRNSMSQKPSIGCIVHFELSEYDVGQIKVQHPEIWATGGPVRANQPHAGDVYPATIVRVFSDTCVNLRVHLDGVFDYWATSRQPATDEDTAGRWFWPPRV